MKTAIIIFLLSLSATAAAQSFRVPSADNSRANKWDMSLLIFNNESEDYGSNGGTRLDLDSDTGWGFSVAYNINANIGLGFDFSYVKPRYNAVLIDENNEATEISSKLDVSTGQFKGIWNIFKGPLTPYVEAGLGWTYLDSNLASSPPITGCWFDPFLGWVCGTFYSTYSDTSFSYSGALGVRWQVNPEFYLRGGYNQTRIDLSSAATDIDLSSWRVDIGTSF